MRKGVEERIDDSVDSLWKRWIDTMKDSLRERGLDIR